jgi:hypothetical protein
MLPDFLSTEEFCQIKKDNSYIYDYILAVEVINYMLNSGNSLPDDNILEIQTINDNACLLTDGIQKGNEVEYLYRPMIIIYQRNNSILWSPVKMKFYKITDDMLFIIELMIKNISFKEITNILMKKYMLDLETANKALNAAYEMLSNNGCIKMHIKVS